jgi:hypothetical protein
MSKVSKVTVVAHPQTKLVITPRKNKPEYGVIRVDQTINSMENGYVNIQKRVAWLGGKITDLQTLGLKEGSTLPGKIVRKESFSPFYEGQDAKINPTTGEVVKKEGKNVFMQDIYTDDLNAPSYEFISEEKLEVVVEETPTTNGNGEQEIK